MKYFLLIVFLVSIQYLKAEEIPHPELKNLFEADLVVDASFKSQDKERFYITVNETIMDRGYGLKKGDQINLPREDDGCGFIVDFSYYKRNRFYLIKVQEGWRLNYGSTQSIKAVDEFGSVSAHDRFCGLSPPKPIDDEIRELNAHIREFRSLYRYDEQHHEFLPMKDSVSMTKFMAKNPILKQFEERGRCCIGDGIEEYVEVEPEPELTEKPIPPKPCGLNGTNAEPFLSQDEFRRYLNENENPLSNLGIEGKVVVQITLSDSGIVNDVVIKRGIHPTLDSIAIDKSYKMQPWKPAVDVYGKNYSCYTMLPYTFKADVTE